MSEKKNGADLRRALAENAMARERFNSLPPEAREKLLRRAEQVHDRMEMKALVDEFLGWQTGHPPYQL